MELQEIEVYIDKDGQVRIEVRGVQGMSCLDLTADLEAALGGEVESREMTPEAYETVQDQVQDRRRLRDGVFTDRPQGSPKEHAVKTREYACDAASMPLKKTLHHDSPHAVGHDTHAGNRMGRYSILVAA